MDTNKELDLAWSFVNHTNRSVFLTGKAGTGKTTFLHKLKTASLKRMVVVAPTGVAAINAKGVTIHSFFQMPFGPILPETDLNANAGFNRKFSKTKINIIKSMDLLVIDEISMVRADLLDGIDKTLRRFKSRDKVFGGVQVLMIGDLQQLSPVIRDNEWQLLKPYYQNGFFFSSMAYQQSMAITIELQHIYRQDNPTFINILNEIRNNCLTESSAAELNKRFDPDFKATSTDGYIALTTHNNRAEATNLGELKQLSARAFTYKAKVDGKFPEQSYPNKETLSLKVGAQVMFIKNDSSPDKRYFNGKIGKIISLNKDEVEVKCPGDSSSITTKVEVWENINYNVDPETKDIKEERIGGFTQIPLRLAWSITIHKSQGLTFEKAIIDAEGAFAHGQTYVALSRCKSLEGLVLKSKIHPKQIISDSNVISFNKRAQENAPDSFVLENSKKVFQLDCIVEIFNFYQWLYPVNRILDIFYKNRGSIVGDIETPLIAMKDCITNLLKVSHGFSSQLRQLEDDDRLPESSKVINERFTKAVTYFKTETEKKLIASLENLKFTTDNKVLETDIFKQTDTLDELLDIKMLYFNNLKDGFKTNTFLELRAKSVFLTKNKPKKKKSTIVDGTTNVDLYEILRILRNEIAEENELIHYQVFTQKALYAMCESLPTTTNQLLKIDGMGKVRVEKYGAQILKAIKAFCEENDIDSEDRNTGVKAEKKVKKVDTRTQSLELFKKGKTIKEIAAHRELNENTIFSHLVTFIPSGKIKITDLMSKKHFEALKKEIPKLKYDTLSDLKHQLDEKYSYGELRLVVEDLKRD
ncbi:helix-turn-helix domain-containing protein [Lacinutrix undariae]